MNKQKHLKQPKATEGKFSNMVGTTNLPAKDPEKLCASIEELMALFFKHPQFTFND